MILQLIQPGDFLVQDGEYIRGITEDILDTVQMKHETEKEKSSINKGCDKINGDINMRYELTNDININEEVHDTNKQIHASSPILFTT